MNLRNFRLSIIFSLVFPASLFVESAHAQSDRTDRSTFAVLLEGGYSSGVSSTMRGTNNEFASDIEKDYNNSKYPFGDPNAFGAQAGLIVRYRFSGSNLGLYSALHLTGFLTNGSSPGPFSGDTADLSAGTFSLGGTYTYDLSQSFDILGRLGLNASLIGGLVDYSSSQTLISRTTRLGYELGAALDWKPGKIFIFSLGVGYTNLNLIGKSYTTPSQVGMIFGRALNDGANPNNPSDSPRTIDFLTFSLSGGIRF
jgi:hypothetical protein